MAEVEHHQTATRICWAPQTLVLWPHTQRRRVRAGKECDTEGKRMPIDGVKDLDGLSLRHRTVATPQDGCHGWKYGRNLAGRAAWRELVRGAARRPNWRARNIYTGMDKTCLYTSSWGLFVSPDVGMSTHVERNNYVPLFGVDPIECRLTLLRNTWRDCYLNIVVPLEYV